MHKVDGHFFTFSPPRRRVDRASVSRGLGNFRSWIWHAEVTKQLQPDRLIGIRDRAVAVGGDIKDGRPVEAGRCEMPVGDYLPEFLRSSLAGCEFSFRKTTIRKANARAGKAGQVFMG